MNGGQEPKRGRGRLPSSPKDQLAKERARKAAVKISALARAGEIQRASHALADAVKKFLKPGDRQGRGRESPLAHAAIVVLSRCVELNRVPPRRLPVAFKILLDVESTDPKWDAVYYVAEGEKVTISGLARVGKIDRTTARAMMKPGSKFQRTVQAVKEGGSEEVITREAQARTRSEAEVAHTKALGNVVRSAARNEKAPSEVTAPTPSTDDVLQSTETAPSEAGTRSQGTL